MWFRWLLSLGLLCLAATPAWAQTTGQLRVTIVDTDDLEVPATELWLHADMLIGGTQQRVSDSLGQHLFVELPPGTYELVARKEGFRTVKLTGIRVHISRTTVQTITLEPTSDRPAPSTELDAGQAERTSRATVLTEEFLATIPTGRNCGFGAVPRNVEDPTPPAVVSPVHAPPSTMTDDNVDLQAFLAYLAEHETGVEPCCHRPIDVSGRRWIDVVDAQGEPLVGATIRISHRVTRDLVAQVRTHGDGRAAAYVPAAARGLDVVVDSPSGPVCTSWSGQHDLRLEVARGTANTAEVPLDVAIVLDTTRDMADEVERLRTSLAGLVERLRELPRAADVRVALVRYRDRGDAYVTQVTDFTRNVKGLARVLRKADVAGGGDHPESLNAALAEAVGLRYRPEAAKVAFVVADAGPHVDDEADVQYDVSLRDASSLGLKVHTVAASGLDPWGTLVFRQIAQYTRGQFVFVTHDRDAARSAAAQGANGEIAPPNDLDGILFDRLRAEIDAYGVAAR